MKLEDIDKVNHLIAELGEINGQMRTAETAATAAYQLFIEAPGDGSLRMSAEGESTTHSRGTAVTEAFLGKLKELAVMELRARRKLVMGDLAALGVDTSGG